MKATLKPCPWCGGTPFLYEKLLRHFLGKSEFVIRCSECGATPPKGEFNDICCTRDYAVQQAVEAWNRRNVIGNTTIDI